MNKTIAKTGLYSLVILTPLFFTYQLNSKINHLSLTNVNPEYDQQVTHFKNEISALKKQLENNNHIRSVYGDNRSPDVSESLIQQAMLQKNIDQESLSVLSNDVDSLKKEVNALYASQSIQRQSASANSNSLNTNSANTNTETQNAERRMNEINLYSSTLYNEDIDSNWSLATEEATLQSLSSASERLVTDNIECRTSLCRLEISRPEGVTDHDTLDAFEMNINWPGEMSMSYDIDTGKAVVFMARSGSPLPKMDNGNQ